jgi:TatD DNase family protein
VYYIDIHTHNINSDADLSVINLYPKELANVLPEKNYSIGIHPWVVNHLTNDSDTELLKNQLRKKNILAIGEIGLDKLKPEFKLQQYVFISQIKLANTTNKPIIIHCVKAFGEVSEILKNENVKNSIIFHRFSGNKTIAEQFVKKGYYLSFGHELFHTKSKVQSVFKTVPNENFFLETDDSQYSIKDIYQKASELRNCTVETISDSVRSNFNKCFRI